MKKNKNNTQTLTITEEMLAQCGFDAKEDLASIFCEGAIIIVRDEMTVLELAKAIYSLSELASDLTAHLAGEVGFCDHCGDDESYYCDDCTGDEVCAFLNGCNESAEQGVANCPLCMELLDDSDDIHIPDYILEDAGIPKGTKLDAFSDDEGGILVTVSEFQEDITDMPPSLVAILAKGGVCLAELDEMISTGELVYAVE